MRIQALNIKKNLRTSESIELLYLLYLLDRGPSFLAVVWFGSSPTPSPTPPSGSSTGDTQENWEGK
jgi:hypothetical protein